jgi:periplasmic divalent cation tolerance protein
LSDLRLVRINCPDRMVAEQVGEALVLERLAACVNITEPVVSVYRWQGEMQRGTEWVVLAKTTRARFEALAARAAALHPDEVPAILAIPMEATAAFGDWVHAETGD